MYLRSLLINICCIALSTALAMVMTGAAALPTAVFVTVVVWLCNAAWFNAVWLAQWLSFGRKLLRRNRAADAAAAEASESGEAAESPSETRGSVLLAMFREGWRLIRKDSVADSVDRKSYRLTALLLLLVPHGIFALVTLINMLFGGHLPDIIGLPLSPAFYGCVYPAAILLWGLSLGKAILPLSLNILKLRSFRR